MRHTTLAALRFALLLALVFVLGGCFEVYEGAVSVTAQTSTTTYALNNTDGLNNQKPITFSIINGDDNQVENVRVTVRLVIHTGNSPILDEDIELVTSSPNITGSEGDYTIGSIPAFGSVELKITALLEPGTYTWVCTADPNGSLDEFNEDDNSATTALTVTHPLLANINLSFDGNADITFTSDANHIHFTIPVKIKVQLPPQNEPQPGPQVPLIRITTYTDGIEIQYWQYYYLVQDNTLLEFSAIPPAGGSGTIRLQLDSSNFIAETNEGDNALSFAFPFTNDN